MAGTIEEDFPPRSDATLNAKIGNDPTRILPYIGINPPLPATKRPFLVWTFQTSIRTGHLTMSMIVRCEIHDNPMEQFWNINAIMADLVRLRPETEEVWYPDPLGAGWRQSFASFSEPLAHDDWETIFRAIEWDVKRGIP